VSDSTELDHLIRRVDPAATLPPPAVLPDPLLDAAHRRPAGRHAPRFAVAGSALAVVGAAVAVLLIAQFTAPSTEGGTRQVAPGNGPGGPVALTSPPSAPRGSGSSPSEQNTGPTESHTPYSGAEFLRAKRLLATLRGVVPDGYTLPPMPTGDPNRDEPSPTSGPNGEPLLPPASFEAVRDEGPQGWTGWAFDGNTNVTRSGRTGSVGIRVWTKVPAGSGNLCSQLRDWYWVKGTCRMVTSGGKQVALTTRGPGNPGGGFDYRADNWASYRYPDGTLVMILQSRSDYPDSTPSLTQPVFTDSQLAALAVDPRFSS
jgi:hypothetical protein